MVHCNITTWHIPLKFSLMQYILQEDDVYSSNGEQIILGWLAQAGYQWLTLQQQNIVFSN